MEVQRTSSEAVGCIAPTRLTRSGPDRTEIPQCSGPLPSRLRVHGAPAQKRRQL